VLTRTAACALVVPPRGRPARGVQRGCAMGLIELLPRGGDQRVPLGVEPPADVVVLEDDPQVAALAVELCREMGLQAAPFPAPAPFLAAYALQPPRVVVLDWLLEREIGSAVFLAVRHRFGDVPIVCWTGMEPGLLPDMVADDARTQVVDKAAGVAPFQDAIRWALDELGAADRTPRP
jgi:FixJ family two-component response regulator